MATQDSGALRFDADWDAGDMGCGELILELRTRMRGLRPGQSLHLIATIPALSISL